MRPIIKNFEAHLLDHCNINCGGCSHFSPLAPKFFADPDLFAETIRELGRKLDITRIRLIGGEPLLHPEAERFMVSARETYQDTRIELVTNGLLLGSMTESFWETARKCDIVFAVSQYPVNADKVESYIKLIEKKGCRFKKIAEHGNMSYILNSRGDSDPKEALTRCRKKYGSCVNLRGRRLYLCGRCYIDYFNKYFGKNYPLDPGIDIFEASGKEMYGYVNTPIELCRYCFKIRPSFEWKPSEKKLSEWDCYSGDFWGMMKWRLASIARYISHRDSSS